MAGKGSPPGVKYGGRQKGTPNRATVDVAARLAALGCDPIEGMAKLAMDPASPPELRGRMYAELAQYTAPKRKAVEHEVANNQIAGFVVIGTGEAKTAEEWKAHYAPKPAS